MPDPTIEQLQQQIATLDRMLADERRENDDLQQRIADLTRELDAQIAESQRLLRDRDAFWNRAEELEQRLAVLEARTPEQLAQQFHDTYERLAPQFGYQTREASRKPWADVPDQNKRLMIAVCAALLASSPGKACCQMARSKGDAVCPRCGSRASSPADKEQP